MRQIWHPWRALRALTNVTLDRHDAAEEAHGWTEWSSPPRITLREDLLQAERRSTLTHELVHLERGPLAGEMVLDAREEETVEREAARRLISLEQLVYALQWSSNEHELAEDLWVDVAMIRARFRALTPFEERHIQRRLDQVTHELEDE
ncbi:ImmA/IrrE family metallo-endopeptidase [Cumulibacter soli]|uniref:ImmA/IrrE family metallo-endopeptidase n=1 Tax=Cumulibacter soli TaxID=2546344 RepID=UPI001ABA856D|nr:ImmA/IrrE family metallo-endopeptidase [Cumulibacter soli]